MGSEAAVVSYRRNSLETLRSKDASHLCLNVEGHESILIWVELDTERVEGAYCELHGVALLNQRARRIQGQSSDVRD